MKEITNLLKYKIHTVVNIPVPTNIIIGGKAIATNWSLVRILSPNRGKDPASHQIAEPVTLNVLEILEHRN